MRRVILVLLFAAGCKSAHRSETPMTWSGIPDGAQATCLWHRYADSAIGTCVAASALYTCLYVNDTSHATCARAVQPPPQLTTPESP